MRENEHAGGTGSNSGPILGTKGTTQKISVDKPFILYAIADITYNGRAQSTLKTGNYLIVHKADGTILVHGNDLCTPRNYQSSKAILKQQDNRLVSTRKNEEIIINIHNIIHYLELENWATNKVNICKTEQELQLHIAANLENLLNKKFKDVQLEHQTPVGIIDIYAKDENDIINIIEVKRKTITLNGVYQLQRYIEYYKEISITPIGYLISPNVSPKTFHLLQKKGFHYLKVDFSSIN